MIIRVFVDQSCKAKVRYGTQILPIIDRMQHAKEKLEMHNERFYWLAAKRLIKEEDYYKTVHKCGWYRGKRAYQPIFK